MRLIKLTKALEERSVDPTPFFRRDEVMRHEGSTPWDGTLEVLGMRFLDAVVANDCDDSRRTLDLIQERSAELLRDILLGKIGPEAERRHALAWPFAPDEAV